MGNVNKAFELDFPRSRASFDCYVNNEQCDASELTSSSVSSNSNITSRAVSTANSASAVYSHQSVLELLLSEVRQLRTDVDGIKEILRNQKPSEKSDGKAEVPLNQKPSDKAVSLVEVESANIETEKPTAPPDNEIKESVLLEGNMKGSGDGDVELSKSDLSAPTSVYSVSVESI